MSRGLFAKSIREVWLATLLFSLGVLGFEAIVAYVLGEFHGDMAEQWAQVRFIQDFVKGLLGTDIGAGLDMATFAAIAWVHPVFLALVWAHEITLCTRIPAGEVDRGTIDVLLSLPVSRWRVYLCESAVWLATGAILITAAVVGFSVASLTIATEDRPTLGRLLIVAVNFYCLYVAVGGLSFLVSSVSSRRGRAIAVVFAIVLASFLLNFLAQLWAPAEKASVLSVLTYYRPVVALREAAWPIQDMLVLTLTGTTTWLLGAHLFTRRDICTV